MSLAFDRALLVRGICGLHQQQLPACLTLPGCSVWPTRGTHDSPLTWPVPKIMVSSSGPGGFHLGPICPKALAQSSAKPLQVTLRDSLVSAHGVGFAVSCDSWSVLCLTSQCSCQNAELRPACGCDQAGGWSQLCTGPELLRLSVFIKCLTGAAAGKPRNVRIHDRFQAPSSTVLFSKNHMTCT